MKLQANIKRKLLLIFAFLVGGFAFVASLNNTVAQFLYSVQFSYFQSGTTKIEGVSGQFLQGVDLVFFNWQTIEVGVGLIASNLSTLRPFWCSAIPSRLATTWSESWESSRLLAKKVFSGPSRSEVTQSGTIRTRSQRSRRHSIAKSLQTTENQWYGQTWSATQATSRGFVESCAPVQPRQRPESQPWRHSRFEDAPTAAVSQRSHVSSTPVSDRTAGSVKRLGLHVRVGSGEAREPLTHIAMQSPEWDPAAGTFYESSKNSMDSSDRIREEVDAAETKDEESR